MKNATIYKPYNVHMTLVPPVSIEENFDAADGYLYTDEMANNRSVAELTKLAMSRFNRFKAIDHVFIYVNGNSMMALGAAIEACKRMHIDLKLLYPCNEDDTLNTQNFYFTSYVEICDD